MTLSLTATNVFALRPNVKLVAASTTSGSPAVPANSLLAVYRVHADGTEHQVLTESAPRFIGGAWVWNDYTMPFNQAVTYRIETAGYSAVSGAVMAVSQRMWLIHPSQPELSVMVDAVAEIADRSTDSRSERFEPIGALAVYLTDGFRNGIKGNLTIRQSDEAAVRKLFADDSVILINTPAQPGWDLTWMWVHADAVKYSNPGSIIRYRKREIVIEFEEAADPDVDLLPIWSSGDAELYWTGAGVTSAGVISHYADSLALQTDTRL